MKACSRPLIPARLPSGKPSPVSSRDATFFGAPISPATLSAETPRGELRAAGGPFGERRAVAGEDRGALGHVLATVEGLPGLEAGEYEMRLPGDRVAVHRHRHVALDVAVGVSGDRDRERDHVAARAGLGRRRGGVPGPVSTHAYGDVEGEMALPVDGESIAWEPHLVFPGLEAGETLDRREDVPERAPILARDGTPLAEGPPAARSSPLGVSALNVAGEIGAPKKVASRELTGLGFPDGSLAGISGLELAFNGRLAGQPGGELLAVSRAREGRRPRARQAEPKPGKT